MAVAILSSPAKTNQTNNNSIFIYGVIIVLVTSFIVFVTGGGIWRYIMYGLGAAVVVVLVEQLTQNKKANGQ